MCATVARGARNPGTGVLLEGFLVFLGVSLVLAAAAGGFVLGRATAPEGGGVAAAETQATETGETETAAITTVTGATETTETTETATTTETAETETARTGTTETGEGGGDRADGAAVFAEAGCGSCHTFGPANATGTVGPNLEQTDLNRDGIERVVRNGRDGMPAFEGRLSDAQIEAVAAYVASG